MIRNCQLCGVKFETKLGAKRYCSRECQAKAANDRHNTLANMEETCTKCGRVTSHRNIINGKCCKCRSKSNKVKLSDNKSLCNVCVYYCRWVMASKPVEGWSAKRNDVNGTESYFVSKCPKFVRGVRS